MSAEPPPELVALLERLGLATRPQVRGVGNRVHRLARELPLFESVWVDALAQARIVTPYQAAEINAGRGEHLLAGDFLLCQKLPSNGLGQWFIARDTTTQKLCRLLQIHHPGHQAAATLAALRSLTTDLSDLDAPVLAPAEKVGAVGDRCWIACRLTDGQVAADWLAHNGRLPPEAVLEIARQMIPGLMALEARGCVHGDLGARQLLLSAAGGVLLLLPGVRGIVRPAEGYSHADLLPEAYDYLAPERVLEGSPPTVASDLYALGCLWWHLLTGRPPLPGGDCLSKLRSAQIAKIADVRRLAPETPPELAEAIRACTHPDPARRPASAAALLETLGPSTRSGRSALADCLRRSGGVHRGWRRPRRASKHASPPAGKAMAAVAAMLLLAGLWFARGSQPAPPLANIRGNGGAAELILAEDDPHAIAPAEREAIAGQPSTEQVSEDLVLPTGRPLRLNELTLRSGQTVRGAAGQRPLVLAPPQGLSIEFDDVTFLGVDFAADESLGPASTAGLLHVRAERVAFESCSFQASASSDRQRAAIVWLGRAEQPRASLPTGVLRLQGCAFRRVATAIECRFAGAVRMELVNSLHLGPGPLVQFVRWPGGDEPCRINLTHCTVRGGEGVFDCRYGAEESPGGEIAISAVECVFAPRDSGRLIGLQGASDPTDRLRSMQWLGQGSVVAPGVSLCQWQIPGGPLQDLADEGLSVSGLVLSPVVFAGGIEADPGASRADRWQVPLQSTDPPGILDVPLPWPLLPGI